MEQHKEGDEPSSQGAEAPEVRDYYKALLRTRYPEWTEEQILHEVEEGLQSEGIINFIKMNQEMDEEIRRDNPDLGWTTLHDFVATLRSKQTKENK